MMNVLAQEATGDVKVPAQSSAPKPLNLTIPVQPSPVIATQSVPIQQPSVVQQAPDITTKSSELVTLFEALTIPEYAQTFLDQRVFVDDLPKLRADEIKTLIPLVRYRFADSIRVL